MFKTFITTILCLGILLSFEVYLYNLAFFTVNVQHYRAWYNIELVAAFFSLRLIENKWIDTFLQESIVKATFLFLYILGADVGLTQLGLVKDPYSMLLVYTIGSLIAVSFLIIQILRNNGNNA